MKKNYQDSIVKFFHLKLRGTDRPEQLVWWNNHVLSSRQVYISKSWRQRPTRHQLYGHLPPIMKTLQVRWTRHAGHCWRSRNELISDVLLWTPTYGRAKAGWPAQTYIEQLCENMKCSPEDLPEVMNDREKWREMVRDIHAGGMTWWWWNVQISVEMVSLWEQIKPVSLLSELLYSPELQLYRTFYLLNRKS